MPQLIIYADALSSIADKRNERHDLSAFTIEAIEAITGGLVEWTVTPERMPAGALVGHVRIVKAGQLDRFAQVRA